MRIKIIYISVQGKSIGNIQNYEVIEEVYWTTGPFALNHIRPISCLS